MVTTFNQIKFRTVEVSSDLENAQSESLANIRSAPLHLYLLLDWLGDHFTEKSCFPAFYIIAQVTIDVCFFCLAPGSEF